MIACENKLRVRERHAAKLVFVGILMCVALLLGGCSSDGEPPADAANATDSSNVSTEPADNTDTTDTTDDTDTSATGGLPSEWMTGVGVDKGSYPYFNRIGEAFSFSVYFKDRYGVYSDLVTTDNVHFVAEDGAATIESVTVENGIATAALRTHDGWYLKAGEAWETALKDLLTDNGTPDVDSDDTYDWWYGVPGGRPSRGLVSVLWYTHGEEWFTEKEGAYLNDSYDLGEHFRDTEEDPYLDENENGQWDAEEPWVDKDGNGIYEAGVDTFTDINSNDVWDWGELFADANGNKKRDTFNTTWDADKLIFDNVTFLMTGIDPYIGWKKDSVTIPKDGSGTVNVIVCDQNFNHLPADATIEFSATMIVQGKEVPIDTLIPEKVTIPVTAASYGATKEDHATIITYPVRIKYNDIPPMDSEGKTEITGTFPGIITVKVSGAGLEETTAEISGVVSFVSVE